MALIKYLVRPFLLFGIILSAVGMHQAGMAKDVSTVVFQAAHRHNWFWADGWAKLFIEETQVPV